MKKFYLLLLSLSMGLSSVFADGVERTYTNVTAGSLSTRISNDNVDPLTITKLTLTGNLNGTDLRLIREMAGNNYLGEPTNGSLKKLDISGANIVAGGEKYLDTDRVTSSTGTYTQMGNDFFHFETQNNVIGNSLFAGCDKLEEIILPNSITSIGDYVFWFCLNLKSLEIPKNVSSIGWAFIYGSNKISNLSVAEDNHNYDSRNNCNAIIETATNTLVRGCINTIVPNDIKIIGDYAFYYCSDLPKITLPEGIISIGYEAFGWCSNLTSITLPSTLKSIDGFALSLTGISSITIPASVETIGERALNHCPNLTTITVEAGNSKFDARDNCNGIIETSSNTLIQGCKATTIPTTVTAIGNTAFTECQDLKSITIPSHIAAIGYAAFNFVHNLTVTVETKVPLEISESSFSYSENITLRVPSGCKAVYAEATGWNKFDNILEGKEGATFTAQTIEGWEMVFSILDESAKTCQVGYIDGSWDKTAVDKESVNGSLTIPNTINGYTVVKIGKCSLNNVDGMTSVTIPNTVTSIDDYAFFSCDGLTSFELPASVTSLGRGALSAFWNVTSLTVAADNPNYDSRNNCNAIIEKATNKIVAGCQTTIIPADVTGIGTLAFDLSRGSIFIPSTVTTIEESAFRCINVTIQVEHTTPLVVSEYAFSPNNSTLRVPAGTKETYAAATGWKNFSTIMEGNEGATFTAKTTEGWVMAFTVLDESAKTCQVGYIDASRDNITRRAVYSPTINGSVTIPSTANGYTVVKIGKYAFENIMGMTSITIPNTVTSIEEHAFEYCFGLTSFELPASVTSLGDRALSALRNVTSLKVAEGNTKYDSRDNCNAIIETASNKLLFGSKSTTIPEDVIEIGEYAFYYLPGYTQGYTLTIPAATTKIDDYAFSYNHNLILQVETTTPLLINENVFQGSGNLTLRVPAGSKSAYAAATGWSKFSTIIEDNKVSKNVATAGTLSQLISDDEKLTITELTITGPLNGTDFRLLREMAGCDYLGRPTNGQLQKLDLSGATIVAGGDKYFDRDGLYDEDGNMQYGLNSHSVTTRDNVIGECLFAGCSKLEEIKIPANIIEIGEFAFMCTNISSFDIPETVEKVALSFFWGTKISTLHIPKNVVTLTASYFMGNQSTLTSITVDADNTKFDSRNNCNAIVEKESNTLLLGCKNTTIPDGITSIGLCAFVRCYNLTSITIPASVTSLQEGAFFDTGLNSISLPSTLKRIEFNALAYTKIASITIPASVEFIGQSALRACSNLTQITVETDNTIYDSREDCNAIIETATKTLIQGCNTATIPATVTAIGNQAFQECHDLANITIPSSVTSIADCAFYECENLTSVSVGVNTPLAISENTFSNRTNATLYVPAGSKATYEASDYWKEFKEIIEIEDPSVLTVNVETAGELSDLISNHDVDPLTITDLTITGPLNSTDLRLIREMAGNDYLGQPTDGVLKKLDLSGADIVAGGEKYLDTDQIISSTEESIPNIGENSFHFATQNNVLGTALFAGCDKLEEIVLPNSIISIGDYVFWYCLNLKALEIPKNVSSIGWRFINGQNDISKLSVAEGNQTFSSPEGSNVLMQGTKMIFGLNSAKVPAGTTIIGSEAFYNCIGLGDVILPEGVTTIERGAFAWSGLTSIKMPSTLTTIENDAFADCSGLTSFTLPKSVTHYGDGLEGGLGALKECGNLASIKVEDGNTKYDSRDNCNAIIETATKTLVSGCKNTVIPNTVTSIGHQAFRGINLSDFDIPNCITTLGERAFCSSSLTSIKIPSSVTKIGELAFDYCNNLTSVSVEVKTPLVITENTFSNRANATLYVPAGSKATYEASDYWKEFKEIIEIEDPSVRTVNVEEEGTLATKISSDDMSSITELTITGPLNGTDFRLLREMAGNDYQGNLTAGKLSKLDLSGATIVSGGDYYLNTTTIHWTDNTQMVMNNPLQYGTNNNVLGSYLFAGCKSLETIILPKNITAIGNDVFSHNPKLRSLEIPKTVSSIAIGVIQECENLSSLSVESGNQTYSSPEGSNAIIHTANLELVAGCKNTVIPSGTKIIDPYAFQHCISLISIKIPESITRIGEYAFWGCYGLTELTIPASVTQIGDQAFYGCSALSSIVVDSENSVYDSRNNCNALIETSSKTLLLGCKNTIIPNDILIIGENAFRPCDGLTSIEIPASVTCIKDNAFAYCYQLERVISNIADPNTVTMGSTVFDRISGNAILEVPHGTKASYLAANGWKDAFSNIVEMSQPSTITVTAKSCSRAYGEANPTFESEVTGGTVTGTPEITCAATATSNVGTYPIVIAAGTITDTNVQYVNGTLAVTKAPLKISAGNYTKKQGEENPTFTLTYDGFKNNETAAVFTTQPTITCAATKDSPAGTYDITVSGAVAGNYEISYVAGTLTVEALTPPTPMPEPKVTTFEEDVDDSSSKEVKVTFVVKESDGSSTPTVAISDDKDASGSVSIPESVTHNGVEYKVTEISEGAFQNNTGLKEVTIPASITSIGANAFAGCKNLQSITINIIVPINIAVISARGYTRAESGGVFDGVDKNTCILYVPEGSVDAYKAAAGWKEFKNILPIKTSTRIYGIESDGEVFDVYSLSGQKVKSKTTSLDGLPRGIYIINGKKVIK